MISADKNSPMPLQLTLADGAEDRGVRVYLSKEGSPLFASTDLTHIGHGAYTGSYVHDTEEFILATFVVYTDTTFTTEDLFYNITSKWYNIKTQLSVDNIASAVWEKLVCHHDDAGTFGGAVAQLLEMCDPSTIGSKVWDSLVTNHTIPSSFGEWVQIIYQYVRGNNEELLDPTHGLDKIYNSIHNRASEIVGEVNDNESKINQIIPAISSAESSINSNVDQFQTRFDAFSTELGDVESGLTGEIGVNRAAISAVEGQVGTIQNNTTTRLAVPSRLVKPTSGSKDYQFQFRLYDSSGNPEAPDFAPTIRIKRLDTGLYHTPETSMQAEGAIVGGYYHDFTVTAGTDEFPIYVEVLVTEGGVTRSVPAVSEITEFETDLNLLQTQISDVQLSNSNIAGKLDNTTYGLSAIKTRVNDTFDASVDLEAKIDLVKSSTDNIPASPAATSDLAPLEALISSKPDIGDIESKINLARDSIKGASSKDITEVFDKWDSSDLLKTNDPRLINLDVAISTRSSHTPNDVWQNSSRTLTHSALTQSDVKAIWSYLTSQCNISGSVGKRIADFLDISVSTRATASQMANLLSGIAQESTVSAIQGIVENQNNENEQKIDDLLALAAQIEGKTQNLPSSPASSSLVESENNATQLELAAVKMMVGIIRAKTDNLPTNPASRQDVEQIPTDPLRDDDARLNNLDARISSIAPLEPEDLEHLATLSELTSSITSVVEQVNENEDKIDLIGSNVTGIKAKTDSLPADPASDSEITSAKADILDAISSGGGGTSGASAAEVWSHPSRTLTQNVDDFKADVSGLAEKSDLEDVGKDVFQCRMSTAFNNIAGTQSVIAWLEKNGEVIDADSCVVVINNSLGVTQWTKTSSSPNSDKVFNFSNAINAVVDENYYITITISVGSKLHQSIQSFVTVG